MSSHEWIFWRIGIIIALFGLFKLLSAHDGLKRLAPWTILGIVALIVGYARCDTFRDPPLTYAELTSRCITPCPTVPLRTLGHRAIAEHKRHVGNTYIPTYDAQLFLNKERATAYAAESTALRMLRNQSYRVRRADPGAFRPEHLIERIRVIVLDEHPQRVLEASVTVLGDTEHRCVTVYLRDTELLKLVSNGLRVHASTTYTLEDLDADIGSHSTTATDSHPNKP